jgi:hypothetical protein
MKTGRGAGAAALEQAKSYAAPATQSDRALIERFERTMRENFSTGSAPFRKAYLQFLIDVIEVDDHRIRIGGRKDLREQAVLASQAQENWCSQMSNSAVLGKSQVRLYQLRRLPADALAPNLAPEHASLPKQRQRRRAEVPVFTHC